MIPLFLLLSLFQKNILKLMYQIFNGSRKSNHSLKYVLHCTKLT